MHKFHFKADPELKSFLKESAESMNMTVSRFVRYIFVQAGDYLEKVLFTTKEVGSVWMECHAKVDVYVWICEEDYRRMKHMHHALNIYSMAQIIRVMVERFVVLLEKYGLGRLLVMVRRFREKWLSRMKKNGWRGIELDHMCQFSRHYTTILSSGFNILRIQRHQPPQNNHSP